MSFDPSHISDYVSDRGPARYFHGREKILGNFNKLIKESVDTQGGSTFLIQGAPGAGKTALLDQCEKLTRRKGWQTATIKPPALWDADELLYCLGKGSSLSVTGGSGKIGVKAGIKAEAKLDVKVKHLSHVIKHILQDGKDPLLLLLDEAQALGIKNVVPSDQKGIVNSILNYIHNGELGKPVILLAAGLGMTEDAFGSLGISRFKLGHFVELGALGKESERAVIRDWLKKRGGAKGDPTEWINAIAQNTHGWPQHITAYADAAAKQIQKDHGEMTPEGLEVVYRLGRERREAYYKRRVKGISRNERCSFARLIQNVSVRDGLDKEDIKEALSQEHGPEKAQDLFHRAVDRGILHSQDGVYTIPIPSMQNWLVSNYARERIEFPPAPQTSRVVRERNRGMER